MKRQFMFSVKAFLKSSKCFKCIVFALLAAAFLEFRMFSGQNELFNLGNPDYGFFLIASGNILDLFIISLPILAILPFGDTYYKEQEFINQILTRSSKASYLVVNTLMSFLTGFLFIFLLLGFMYVLNYLMLNPSADNPLYCISSTVVENNNMPIVTHSFFVTELLENPAVYNWIYIFILSAYAGLLSMTTFSISLCVKKKIVAYISPFAITLISIPVCNFLPAEFQRWTPNLVFSPGGSTVFTNQEWALLFWVSFFLIITISFNMYKYRKDVLE